MPEYIEREDVREMMRMEFDDNYADEAVDRLPAADVAPVRYGRWIRYEPESAIFASYECSVCSAYPTGGIRSYYCPNCGAKMDGGDGV